MATIRELQKKIDLLDKGLKSKATKPALKIKMRKQVSELKKEIKVLERASSRGLNSIEKAKLLAKKRRSKQTNQSTNDSDIESDAKRYAINKTKRVSKGGRANQYGTKAENKGGIYYESRENRYDRQNKRYAKLEDGGMMAKGGKLKVNGEDFSFLLELSDKELSKKLDLVRNQKSINAKQYFSAREKGESTTKIEESGNNLDNQERAIIEARIRKNKMADGGMMAKGGVLSLKDKIRLREIERQIKEEEKTIKEFEEDDAETTYDRFGNPSAPSFNQQVVISAEDNLERLQEERKNLLKGKKMSDGGTTDIGGTEFSTEDLSGMFANGGSIKNQYKGRSAEDIWDSWTLSQRTHFLKDHYLPNLEKSLNRKEYEHAVNSISEVSLMNWNKLPSSVHSEVERHIFMGQYANGGETHRREDGMYAKGGETSKYKHKIILEIDKNNDSVYEGGEKFDVAIFTSKGDALMCVRALQEKAPNYYHYRLISN